LEIEAHDGARAADATAADWSVSLPFLLGEAVMIRDTLTQAYVADWDIEVAQQSRIPDPKIRRCTTGLQLTASVDAGGYEIGGSDDRLEAMESRVEKVSMAVAAGGMPGSDKMMGLPPMLMPEDHVRIESPRVLNVPLLARGAFDNQGQAVWRQLGPQYGADRDLVLTVRTTR
jgi:hypothetical protein